MILEEYIDTIEEILTDDGAFELSETLIEKFAERSVELQKEFSFTLDDLIEELEELIPSYLEKENWDFVLTELASLILDEMTTDGYDEEDKQYGYNED